MEAKSSRVFTFVYNFRHGHHDLMHVYITGEKWFWSRMEVNNQMGPIGFDLITYSISRRTFQTNMWYLYVYDSASGPFFMHYAPTVQYHHWMHVTL